MAMQASLSSAPAAAPSLAGMHVFPGAVVKVVHFVRHGEAWSNVAGQKEHAQYRSEEWFDAALSDKGWQQAAALGRHISRAGIRPQLVVVSPLTRALQTASAAFGSGPVQPGSSRPPLMGEITTAIPSKQVPHPAISADGAPPFLAHELCREHLGVNPCDRRQPTAHYRNAFPAVDFSLVVQEEDVLWQPEVRESKEDIRARGAAFLAWLAARPEHEIAVVSHSSFLHFMCTGCVHAGQSEAVVAELTRWFENCELRTLVLADPAAGSVTTRSTNFPGGTLALVAEEGGANGRRALQYIHD